MSFVFILYKFSNTSYIRKCRTIWFKLNLIFEKPSLITVNSFAANTLWVHRFISYVCFTGCWRDRMYNVHKEKFHLGMLILYMLLLCLGTSACRDAIESLGLHCT